MELTNKIVGVCQKIDERIQPGIELVQSGILESYTIMEIICQLELECSITFMPEEIMSIDNFSYIDNIIAMIRKKLK